MINIKMNLTISNKPIRPLTKQKCIEMAGVYSTLKYLKEFNGTEKELANYINQGYVIIPAIFKNKVKNPKGNYTRRKDNFHVLNTLFVDVDNAIEKTIINEHGKKERIKINFYLGDPKHITIEQAKNALKELGLDYCIIYKTLSHTDNQHKFRIGFKLKETITNPDAADKLYRNLCHTLSPLGVVVDTKALECSRLFYPGTVIETKDSYLDVTKLKEFKEKVVEPSSSNKRSSNKTNESKKKNETTKKETKLNVEINTNLNLNVDKEYIINFLNEEVQEIVNIDFGERYDQLSNIIDLQKLLKVAEYQKFNCIFHEDHDPSAYVYRNEHGYTTYHCFGCNERLNGVQFVKKKLALDENAFLEFLEENTQIRVGTEYQKKCAKIATYNKYYLLDKKGFKRDNEIVYNYLKRRNLFLLLETLYDLGSLYATYYPLSIYNDGITFFNSLKYVQSFYNDRYRTKLTEENIRVKVNALANIGLIKKLSIKELNETAQKNCKSWVIENNKYKYPNFYYLTPLTWDLLKSAETIIQTEKELGVKARNACKKQALIVQEEKRASEIYVQNGRKYVVEEERLFRETVSYIDSLEKTYFEIEEVSKNIDKSCNYRKDYKIRQIEIYMTKLIKDNVVKKVKCSKKNKELYGIPDTYTHYKSVYVIL